MATQPYSEESVRESLREIRKVTLRAQDLTGQLRSFAKGEVPSMALVQLQPLLNEAIHLAVKGIAVRPTLDLPRALPSVMADGTQILQVFHNLFLNGVQAMPGGGELKVIADILPEEEAQFLALDNHRWVRLRVIDTGLGIPPEALTHIFEPFFTTKPKGTGLGLATCYTVVKRHGGHLKAESSPGRGTTFQVLLPASDLMAARGSAHPHSASHDVAVDCVAPHVGRA